jgi:rRNA-processing protein FCF1
MEPSANAVLLDTNMLVLLVVGRFDRRLIGSNRLDEYDSKDFDLLLNTVKPFARNLTTPHILAELSNLTDQCVPKHRHREFRKFVSEEIVTHLDERWAPASELCETAEFIQLGLADAAVCRLANEKCSVLSVDAELCNVLWGRGVNAENFNHIRDR